MEHNFTLIYTKKMSSQELVNIADNTNTDTFQMYMFNLYR